MQKKETRNSQAQPVSDTDQIANGYQSLTAADKGTKVTVQKQLDTTDQSTTQAAGVVPASSDSLASVGNGRRSAPVAKKMSSSGEKRENTRASMKKSQQPDKASAAAPHTSALKSGALPQSASSQAILFKAMGMKDVELGAYNTKSHPSPVSFSDEEANFDADESLGDDILGLSPASPKKTQSSGGQQGGKEELEEVPLTQNGLSARSNRLLSNKNNSDIDSMLSILKGSSLIDLRLLGVAEEDLGHKPQYPKIAQLFTDRGIRVAHLSAKLRMIKAHFPLLRLQSWWQIAALVSGDKAFKAGYEAVIKLYNEDHAENSLSIIDGTVGATVIWFALAGNLEMVQRFCRVPASLLEQTTLYAITPLHASIYAGDASLFAALLAGDFFEKKSGEPQLKLNSLPAYCDDLLDCAIEAVNYSVVQLLVTQTEAFKPSFQNLKQAVSIRCAEKVSEFIACHLARAELRKICAYEPYFTAKWDAERPVVANIEAIFSAYREAGAQGLLASFWDRARKPFHEESQARQQALLNIWSQFEMERRKANEPLSLADPSCFTPEKAVQQMVEHLTNKMAGVLIYNAGSDLPFHALQDEYYRLMRFCIFKLRTGAYEKAARNELDLDYDF